MVPMLQSLIHQCAKLVPDWAKRQIMKKEYAGDADPIRMSIYRLRSVLNDILSGQDGSGWCCVIDALNNCEETEGAEFLESFAARTSHEDCRESTANLRLLITSRPSSRLRSWERILKTLDTSFINLANHPGMPFGDSDVSRYVRAKVQSFKHYEKTEQESISLEILEKSRGMLQVGVQCSGGLGEENKPHHASQIFDKKFPDMVQMFDEVLTNLARGPSDRLALVRWLLVAEKPLTVRELITAIQIQDGPFSQSFDLDDDEATVATSIFMGEEALIILDGFVHIIHPSIRTQFENGSISEVSEAHFNAAQACVKYLGARSLNRGPLMGGRKKECWADYQHLIQQYPFLEYAAAFWFTHLLGAGPAYLHRLWDLVCTELDCYPKWALTVQVHQFWHQRTYIRGQPFIHKLTNFCSPHLSHENLDTIVLEIMQATSPGCFARFGLNSVDEAGRPALWCAVEQKAVQIVQWLMNVDGLDCNCPDQEAGMSPALLAVKMGHVGMVGIFLKNDNVDWKCKDKVGRTPLFWAVAKNLDTVMRQLLTLEQFQQSLNHCCPEQPPLVHAARLGHDRVVEVLLDHGAHVNGVDNVVQRTALSWAAGGGYNRVVELLLTHWEKIDFDLQDRKYNRTAFQWAAAGKHSEIMSGVLDKMLRRWGQHSEEKCTSLLREAAEYGRLETVRLVLEQIQKSADSFCGQDGRTILSIAAEFGKLEIVEALVARHDADVNAKDGKLKTPLMWASQKGHAEVVGFLLGCGEIDINAEDSEDKNARDWAHFAERSDIVDQIRERQRQIGATNR